MAGLEKKLMGGALIMLLIMGGMWITSQFLNGLALTVGNFVVGTVLIIVGLMLVSMYASSASLNADTLKNAAGGFKRGAAIAPVSLILIVAVLAAFAGMGAYLLFFSHGAQSVAGGVAPAVGSATSTDTYVVHGLTAASSLTAISCPTLSTAQTPIWPAHDMDQNSVVVPTANATLKSLTTGEVFQATTSQPGSVIYNLGSTTNYINDLTAMRTGCSDTGPVASSALKAVDTGVSFAVYNQGGHTLNTVAANQTMTAGTTKTFDIEITPSAKNKHIAGTDQVQFAVMFNATTPSNWTASNFAAKLTGGFATSGASCTPMALSANPAALTGYVAGFICNGDFSGQDTGTYTMDFSVYPVSTYAAGDATVAVCIAPVEYYQQVNNQVGKPKGSIQTGAVKDDGSAIQAVQCKNIAIA